MINPMKLVQIKPLFSKFQRNHPKFTQFLSAAGRSGMTEGSVIEISITNPDDKNICTNLKLTADDIELFHAISELARGQ